MIGVRIAGTGSALPSRVVGTAELLQALLPDRDPVKMAARVGIRERRWLGEGESAAGLAAAAVAGALAEAGLAATELSRIILCTSTGGDQMIPATAVDVAFTLGLDDSCDAFDVANSCVGFLTGLDLGARSVDAGPVAVVAVETFSRDLSPRDARAMMVLGDAAAAAVLVPDPDGGVLASHLRWTRRLHGRMNMPTPRAGAERTWHGFGASTGELLEHSVDRLRAACEQVLGRAGCAWSDVDWFLPHQPNGEMLAVLERELGIPAARTVPVVQEIGSVGAASVAFSLDRLVRAGRPRPGDRVLLASVGAGMVYGALLLRWA